MTEFVAFLIIGLILAGLVLFWLAGVGLTALPFVAAFVAGMRKTKSKE